MSKKIFVSLNKAKLVKIDEFITIFEYFTNVDSDLASFVTAKLDGPHSLRINRASEKLFFLIDGEADMVVGEKEYHLKKGDAILVPINTWHSITSRNAYLAIITVPPYNAADEEIK